MTVPVGSSARRILGRVHRAELSSGDRTNRQSIPVTSATRTAVDCAGALRATQLADLVDNLIFGGFTTAERIERVLAGRNPQGLAGSRSLREVLRAWTDAIEPDSPAELRLLRRLAGWGLPQPVMQHRVHDGHGCFVARLDAAWPQLLVAMEYDGRRYHGPRRIEHDEIRHARLEALGWHVERVDRDDLGAGSHRLRDRLAAVLSKRRVA